VLDDLDPVGYIVRRILEIGDNEDFSSLYEYRRIGINETIGGVCGVYRK